MTHKALSIDSDIAGERALYMRTHNNDSLGYKLGIPLTDIHTIRKFIGDLPELTKETGQGTIYLNKRDYIKDQLIRAGFLI